MSLSDAGETALLKLILQNIDWTDIGDAGGLRGSATAGNVYVALHTADPTDAGNEGSSECSYTNYARVAVARSTGGWTVSGDTASNAASITFPKCGTGATQTATHFSVGVAPSGATAIIVSGALDSSLIISQNVTPQFDAGTLTGTAS